MQVCQCYVELYDVKVANGSHGEECAERLELHDWQKGFGVIHSRLLVVASCNQLGLALLEYTILELVMKNPSQSGGTHPRLVWH